MGLRELGIRGYCRTVAGAGFKNPDQVNHILRGPRGSPETQQSRADKESRRRALMVRVIERQQPTEQDFRDLALRLGLERPFWSL